MGLRPYLGLATIERLFGVAPLTQRDTRANDVLHLIQSTMRTDCPTTLDNPVRSAQPSDAETPAAPARDDTPLGERGNLAAFLALHTKAVLKASGGDAATRRTLIDRFAALKTVGDARAYLADIATTIEGLRARAR